MRRIYIAITAIFIFIAIIFLHELHAQDNVSLSSAEDTIEITGDFLEYDKFAQTVRGEGNITVIHQGAVLKAREVFLDLDQKKLDARGNVSLLDEQGEIRGESLVYDLNTKTGIVKQGYFTSLPWFGKGSKIERIGDEKVIIHNGYFTTSDYDSPEYRFAAKKITVYIKKKIVARNVVMYAGKVPVFYTPIFFRSLNDRRLNINVILGYSESEGNFVKTRFAYPLTEHTYGKLYLDYFGLKGWGKGIEYNYNFPDKAYGSMYGYHIKEKNTLDNRWNTRFSHWHRMTDTITSFVKLDIFSDESFDTTYNNKDNILINSDITSYAAITQSHDYYTLNIIGERRDIWDNIKDKYITDFIDKPRLTFNTKSNKLNIVPLYYRYSLSLRNRYTKADDVDIFFTDNDMSLTNNYNMGYGGVVMPTAGMKHEWQNIQNNIVKEPVFRTVVYTSINLRNKITNWFETNIIHNYEKEIHTHNREYQGIISHNIGTSLDLRNRRLVKLTVSSSYNLMETHFISFRHRWSTIASRLTLTPYSQAKFSLEHDLSPVTGKTKQFISDSEYKTQKWGVSTRTTSVAKPEGSTQISKIDVTSGAFIHIYNKWFLQMNIRYDVFNSGIKINQSLFKDHEYIISRDLHSWEVQASYKEKKLSDSTFEKIFWLKLNMKAFKDRKLGIYFNSLRDEWNLTRE